MYFIFWKVYITNLQVIIEHLLIFNMWLIALVNNTPTRTHPKKKKKSIMSWHVPQVTARIHDPRLPQHNAMLTLCTGIYSKSPQSTSNYLCFGRQHFPLTFQSQIESLFLSLSLSLPLFLYIASNALLWYTHLVQIYIFLKVDT